MSDAIVALLVTVTIMWSVAELVWR